MIGGDTKNGFVFASTRRAETRYTNVHKKYSVFLSKMQQRKPRLQFYNTAVAVC